jgi:hypothetical protein
VLVAPPARQLGSNAPSVESLRTEAHAPRASFTAPASIEVEVGALAEVRGALARGAAQEAIAKLDAYGRAFPQATLAEEATVLRVDALSLLGDRAAAARLAGAFLASHPSSPHAPHLEAVIAGVQNR